MSRLAMLLLMTCLGSNAAFAQSGANAEWSSMARAPEEEVEEVGGLTNEDVIQLVIGGVPEQVIMSTIHSSNPAFDISANGLIGLTNVEVPQRIIGAIIARQRTVDRREAATAIAVKKKQITHLSNDSPEPLVPHVPGIYMINPSGFIGKMRRVEPVYADLKKGSFMMQAASMGLMGGMGDARIKGARALIQTTLRSPTFYIYFDESVPENLRSHAPTIWSSGGGATIATPQDLDLVKFEQKKGHREARIGKRLKDKHEILFSTELLAPGIYRLSVRSHLQPGQYGLVQSVRGNDGKGRNSARIFDFEVG